MPSPGTKRRTSETLVLAESQSHPGILACTDSLMANEVAAVVLDRGLLNQDSASPKLPTDPWQREVRRDKSRFDFAHALPDGRQLLLEVKSVTMVENNGRGLFPDAPTKRGARHLRELAKLAGRDMETAVLFCISRSDGLWVEPFAERDPDFATAFEEAVQAGVRFLAVRLAYDERGAWFVGRVPVRPAHSSP